MTTLNLSLEKKLSITTFLLVIAVAALVFLIGHRSTNASFVGKCSQVAADEAYEKFYASSVLSSIQAPDGSYVVEFLGDQDAIKTKKVQFKDLSNCIVGLPAK